MNMTRRARLIFITICALAGIGLGFGFGYGTRGPAQPAQPARHLPQFTRTDYSKIDKQLRREQDRTVRGVVKAMCDHGSGAPAVTAAQLAELCREWHLPLHPQPVVTSFSRRLATSAQYEDALHALIWADDGPNVFDAARNQIVRFMGDVTFDNGHNYNGLPCDHGAIVTNTPDQANFVTVHYAYGCDGLQPIQNWPNGNEYWFGGAIATSSTIYNYGARISTSGSACMFGCIVGNYIAAFDASTLDFKGLTQVTGPAEFMSFGGSAPWNGGHWIIGTTAPSTCPQLTDCKSATAVFIPGGDEADPSKWQFGSTLSADASPRPDFGTVVSLIRSGTEWVMVTKDFDLLGTHIKALTAECLVTGCIWTQVPLSTWSISTTGTSYSAVFDQYDPAPTGQVNITYAENDKNYYGLHWTAPVGLPS